MCIVAQRLMKGVFSATGDTDVTWRLGEIPQKVVSGN
jgi:hypothetical protein